jgi:hypothetical protein
MSDNIVLIDLKPYTKQMFVPVPCHVSAQSKRVQTKTTKQSGTFWYGNVLEGFAKIKVRSLE